MPRNLRLAKYALAVLAAAAAIIIAFHGDVIAASAATPPQHDYGAPPAPYNKLDTDTTPPTVTVLNLPDGLTIPIQPYTVIGSAADAGSISSGVDRVEVQVNDAAPLIASGATDWSITLTFFELGTYTIQFRAFDKAGNPSEPLVLHLNVLVAGAGEVAGTVENAITHAPISHAQITIEGMGTRTCSDSSGVYDFGAIPTGGPYTFSASAAGFRKAFQLAMVVSMSTQVVEFALSPLSDIDDDNRISASDVQLVINAALDIEIGGLDADLNGDKVVDAVDVQLEINAALGA